MNYFQFEKLKEQGEFDLDVLEKNMIGFWHAIFSGNLIEQIHLKKMIYANSATASANPFINKKRLGAIMALLDFIKVIFPDPTFDGALSPFVRPNPANLSDNQRNLASNVLSKRKI